MKIRAQRLKTAHTESNAPRIAVSDLVTAPAPKKLLTVTTKEIAPRYKSKVTRGEISTDISTATVVAPTELLRYAAPALRVERAEETVPPTIGIRFAALYFAALMAAVSAEEDMTVCKDIAPVITAEPMPVSHRKRFLTPTERLLASKSPTPQKAPSATPKTANGKISFTQKPDTTDSIRLIVAPCAAAVTVLPEAELIPIITGITPPKKLTASDRHSAA